MCWSTGREPIAQPPGSDTRRLAEARQQRAEHEDRRAHRLHQLVRRLGRGRCRDASSVTASGAASLRSARTPMLRSSFSVVATSCSRGTLASVTGSAVSSAAHSSGSAAFLAPEMATSPSSAAAAADQKFVHGAWVS